MPKKTAMLCALLFSAFVCLGGAAPAQAAGNTTNDSFNPQRDSPGLEVEVSSPPACQRSMSTQRRLSIVILL